MESWYLKLQIKKRSLPDPSSTTFSNISNIFVERYSDSARKTDGGPFRDNGAQSDFFVYYFEPNKTFFIYNTQELAKRVSELIETLKLKPVSIPNKSWITTGYPIPRKMLEDLELSYSPSDEDKAE
jgi:hypothetical protein